ncbi:alpha amylase [Seiridium cupressi]
MGSAAVFSATETEKVYAVPDDVPCPTNSTMFQGFEWYIPADHQHWVRLASVIPHLSALGVTRIWIPPATKGMWFKSNGYDVYDLYDLGEFPQKGARETKYGTKDELVRLVNTANSHGVDILFDAILNHRTGADQTETIEAVEVDPKGSAPPRWDRWKNIGESQNIEAWTRFDFPGRGNTYSSLNWTKEHFNGVDYNHTSQTQGIWRFQGKKWARDVDEELGNYDFLHPAVRRDLFRWATWLGSQLKLGGLRLDAVRHYSASFLRDFIRHIDETMGGDWFIVGEYWRADAGVLSGYIEYMNNRLSLFDVPLVESFSKISRGIEPDMRKIFDGSLVTIKSANTVTLVTNHDTQTGQTLDTPVEPYFVPIAYAIILLRANFGLPCVFWADLYGTLAPPHPQPPPHGGLLVPRLMLARKLWAYGTEVSYFSDSATCVGFTRFGHPSHSGGAGLAVVANTAWRCDRKRMCVGRRHAGERWADVLGQAWGEVLVDEAGYGIFPVRPRGVSVWANKDAQGWNVVESFVFCTQPKYVPPALLIRSVSFSDHKNYSVLDGTADDGLPKPPKSFPAWLQSALQTKGYDHRGDID